MRIILIDDNKDSLRSLEKFLKYTGNEIDSFYSPKNAYENILAGESYDVIISDYKMPNMNGIDLIKEAKDRNTSIVTILYTGYDDEMILAKVKETKVDYYFKKPIKLNQLLESIKGEKND